MWEPWFVQPDDSAGTEIQNEFAYRYQLAAIPAAGVCCSVAATIMVLTKPPQVDIAGLMTVLSLLCFWLRWRVLPKIQHRHQLDIVASIVFGIAAFGNAMGAFDVATDSPVSCGLLLLGAAFAFQSGSAYTAFVILALAGQFTARFYSPNPIDLHYTHLLVLTPIYCVIVYMAASALKNHVNTARKQLQDNLNKLSQERERRIESEKRLLHAQKMEGLGLVAAGVAHDFNNHLQAIIAFSDLVLSGDDSQSNVEQIRLSAFNAAEICSQMLAYAGKNRQQLSLINVGDLIRDSQPVLATDLPETVSLQYYPPEGDTMIYAGKSEVRECFLNIARNAIEACESSGWVSVSAKTATITPIEENWRVFGNELPAGTYVVIEVTDSGCGMEPDTLERAFDPYFTTKSTGHGFGLATSLGIMRTYRGAIRVRTSRETGTTVQMLFPPADQVESIELETPNAAPQTNLAQRVLLVDDEVPVAQSVSKLLQKIGCEVTCANSGSEGLEILIQTDAEFDLILIDYSMPNMSGVEFLELIREKGFDTPTIICTGYAKEQIRDRQGVRPDGFLIKPYTIPDLMRIVETISG